MLAQFAPRPERTAVARARADALRLQAMFDAYLSGDEETARELADQEPGTRPFDPTNSYPPTDGRPRRR